MKPIQTTLGILLLLTLANSSQAQTIQWSTGYPGGGTKSSTIQVKGIVTPGKYTQDGVKIEAWITSKTNVGTIVWPATIAAANLSDNKDGTFTFVLDNIQVGTADAVYNVVATATFKNMGVFYADAETQPTTAKSTK